METRKFVLRKEDHLGNPEITIDIIGSFSSKSPYYKIDPVTALAVKKGDPTIEAKLKRCFLKLEEKANFDIIRRKFLLLEDLKNYVEWCKDVDKAVIKNKSKVLQGAINEELKKI